MAFTERSVLLVLLAFLTAFPHVADAQPRRAVRRVPDAVGTVSAVAGTAMITSATEPGPARALAFRDGVAAGDEITTGADGGAEVLVGPRALLTIEPGSRVGLAGRGRVTVMSGAARLASMPGKDGRDSLTIETPTARAVVLGTLLRAAVTTDTASPVETFEVFEGTVDVAPTARGATPVRLAAGQRVSLSSGSPGGVTSGVVLAADTGPVAADAPHVSTPEDAQRHLVSQEVAQADALVQALRGTETARVDDATRAKDDAIVATQAVDTAASAGGYFGAGVNPFARGTPGSLNRSGTGVGDDINDAPKDLKTSPGDRTFFGEQVEVRSGELLQFKSRTPVVFRPRVVNEDVREDFIPERQPIEPSRFAAITELVRVDGGNPLAAPHGGIPPTSTLVARGITGTNEKLILAGELFGVEDPGDPFSLFQREGLAANAFVMISRSEEDRVRGRAIVNDSIDTEKDAVGADAPTAILSDFSSLSARGKACTVCSEFDDIPDVALESHVDGSITARSPLTGDRLVTLNGGVVLDEGTTLTVGTTAATSQYFAARSAFDPTAETFDGSVIAVLASQDGGFNPAFVKINDRALGVQGGSTIAPEANGQAKKVALLSVLDSQLIGPEPTDTGWQRFRDSTPPLVEIIDSNPPPALDPGVTVASAVVVRSTGLLNGHALDRALLEASAPLVALINSTMTTTSHFVDVSGAGPNGKGLLLANLAPGDALVRLDASRLVINGHLLSVTSGAAATINGPLFSLVNGSSLTVNGALVRVGGAGSLFTLNGNSLGAFGAGANTLTIANGLCGASACRTIANIPVHAPGVADLRQVVTVSGNASAFRPFSVPPGTPVPAGGTPANARADVRPNDAFLLIEPGGRVQINPR